MPSLRAAFSRLVLAGALHAKLAGSTAVVSHTHQRLRASDDAFNGLSAQQPRQGSFTQQPRQGSSSRKTEGNGFGNVIVGLLLWWIAPVLLWNNERIAIKQYKMQLKAESHAVHIDDPERPPIPELNGRIVYISGTSTCTENISDGHFKNVKAEGKLKLRRQVEMYQWMEHRKEVGEGDNKRTEYSYTQEWCDCEIKISGDSSKQNPPMPMSSTQRQPRSYRAAQDLCAGNGIDCAAAEHENVKLGAYYFNEYVIREMNNWKNKEDVTAEMLISGAPGGSWFFGGKGNAAPALDGEWWYFGGKGNVEIGSIRVKFEELLPGPISIVGVLTHTEIGWTFVPIIRPDAAGAGDSLRAEMDCSCCMHVEELHYGDESTEDELKERLAQRPSELSTSEVKTFGRSNTTANVSSYSSEPDLDDLCCVGPFGGVLMKVMTWFGIEEEFLGVRESHMSLPKLIKGEKADAANRHHIMRAAGLLLLLMGSYMIIDPIVRILNAHWLITLFGGGLVSIVLCCCACCCSFAGCITIVSTAWIAHRPFLASFGLVLVVCMTLGAYIFFQEQHAKSSSPTYGAFLVAFQSTFEQLHH